MGGSTVAMQHKRGSDSSSYEAFLFKADRIAVVRFHQSKKTTRDQRWRRVVGAVGEEQEPESRECL